MKCDSPQERSKASAYHRLDVISIDMKDGGIESLGHICTVRRAAALLGVSGECNLSTAVHELQQDTTALHKVMKQQ